MEIKFKLVEKTFTRDDGQTIKYYVLQRELIDGQILEVAIKGDKSKLLLMSLALENKR